MYFAVAVVAIVSLVLVLTGRYLSYNWLVMFLLLILWYCASATFGFSFAAYYSLAVIRVCGYGGAISTGSFVRACSYGGVEVILITLFITWSRVSLLLSLAPPLEVPQVLWPWFIGSWSSRESHHFSWTGRFLRETCATVFTCL